MFEGSCSLSVCTIDLNNLALISIDTANQKFFYGTRLSKNISVFSEPQFRILKKIYGGFFARIASVIFAKKTIIDIWECPKYVSNNTDIISDNRV